MSLRLGEKLMRQRSYFSDECQKSNDKPAWLFMSKFADFFAAGYFMVELASGLVSCLAKRAAHRHQSELVEVSGDAEFMQVLRAS